MLQSNQRKLPIRYPIPTALGGARIRDACSQQGLPLFKAVGDTLTALGVEPIIAFGERAVPMVRERLLRQVRTWAANRQQRIPKVFYCRINN